MELVLSLALGLGLAAACGFRVFVPLLGVSIASQAGHLELTAGCEWIGTWPAFICFLTATLLEIGAYYIPWLDNFLDSLATPAAIVGGTIVTASVLQDMSPMLRWSLAAIAGGGVAGTIQTGTVALRGTSSIATGGLGNFALASGELGLSGLLTSLSILVPLVGLGLAILCLAVMGWIAWKTGTWLFGNRTTAITDAVPPQKERNKISLP